MGKDNELRAWALNHWKVNGPKYTGEVTEFKDLTSEYGRQFKLEKPARLISKNTMISMILYGHHLHAKPIAK